MSQHVSHVPAALVEFPRRTALMLLGLLVVAAVAISIALIANNGDDGTAPVNRPASTSTSGPNETLRGNAAAGAVGAQSSSTGGPNETLRGHAAAGATR